MRQVFKKNSTRIPMTTNTTPTNEEKESCD